jgi:hypothetical protein
MTTKTETKRKPGPKGNLSAKEQRALEVGRRALCERSFTDFLRYVVVQDPPPGAGLLPFTQWPHLMEAAEALVSHSRIVWGKARQIGATTIIGAYAYWRSYEAFTEIGLFSQGEEEANDFLAKTMLVHQYLPADLQMKLDLDNLGKLAFGNGSRIRAFPSTKKAGRGMNFSVVVMDEADFHEYFDVSYQTLMPTVDKHGQMIVISTGDPDTHESGFKKLLRAAPGNGYYRIYYPWNVVPGRTEAWLEERRLESLNQAQFEKNYTSSLEQMLAPSIAHASFDLDRLEDMKKYDVREPVETNGPIKIFQHRRVGQRYVAGTDVSHGVGKDYSATVVLERDTGQIVADILDNLLDPEALAIQSIKLMNMYDNPLWAIEDNESGDTVISVVEQSAGFPTYRLYRGTTGRGNETRGWHTDAVTRTWLWDELKMAVKAGQIHIPNAEGLAQFFNVQRNPKKEKVRDEALGGASDDYPVAVGIAWQIRQKAYGTGMGKVAQMAPRF